MQALNEYVIHCEYAYLVLTMHEKTKQPLRISVYSESSPTPHSFCTNFLIAEISLKADSLQKSKFKLTYATASKYLKTLLHDNVYDDIEFQFQGVIWTIKEARAKIAAS
jgi:hypothetical protein